MTRSPYTPYCIYFKGTIFGLSVQNMLRGDLDQGAWVSVSGFRGLGF